MTIISKIKMAIAEFSLKTMFSKAVRNNASTLVGAVVTGAAYANGYTEQWGIKFQVDPDMVGGAILLGSGVVWEGLRNAVRFILGKVWKTGK